MQTEPEVKKKKSDKYSLKIWQFLVIWSGSHIVTLLSMWWILDSIGRFNPLDATNAILMGLGMGVPISIVQYLLIKKLLYTDLKFWIPMSTSGWLASGIVLYLTSTQVPMELSYQILLFFLIPAFAQTIILKRYIQNPWLWLLANAVGGIVLALPITTSRSLEAAVLTSGGILQTLVTGGIIFWLFRQSDAKSKKSKSS